MIETSIKLVKRLFGFVVSGVGQTKELATVQPHELLVIKDQKSSVTPVDAESFRVEDIYTTLAEAKG